MNSFERMTAFLNGKTVDRIPFMPIMMRFCAKHTKTPYGRFILDPAEHCKSNIITAEFFSSDWVNVMSDPYGELEAYGAHINYPEDSLPTDEIILFDSPTAMSKLPKLDFSHRRLQGRLEELRIFRDLLGDSQIICGWVEGVLAEYCDLRSVQEACFDLYDDIDAVQTALKTIYENARDFALLQIEAGANMIGIGDAACSVLGPKFYKELGWEYEKKLVELIHEHGALAKLHICGNTTLLLPEMIATGADIIDVDHLVNDMRAFVDMLGTGQCLCGNIDPVTIVQDGTIEEIQNEAKRIIKATGGKLILSAGCEITPDTPEANLLALANCCI